LTAADSFGETCIEPRGVRTATVTALCVLKCLRIPRSTIEKIIALEEYAPLKDRLDAICKEYRTRDESVDTGRLLPPDLPPERFASKLLLAQNLLVIDMDRCTRCDQCVRGCAETHGGLPRFQRANPEYRFGRWEVAAACVHCSDAPCQLECPYGAITRLDTGAVEIHRDRCTGCGKCPDACPFDVIWMCTPVSPRETPSLAEKLSVLATKCDLCLTSDRQPPCVVSCPYDAARRLTPTELFEGLKSWSDPRTTAPAAADLGREGPLAEGTN
jgi:Fe-S-cluster-containing hydrogenase component 2